MQPDFLSSPSWQLSFTSPPIRRFWDTITTVGRPRSSVIGTRARTSEIAATFARRTLFQRSRQSSVTLTGIDFRLGLGVLLILHCVEKSASDSWIDPISLGQSPATPPFELLGYRTCVACL